VDDGIEKVVRSHVGPDTDVVSGPDWLTVLPPSRSSQRQGWKLHISARPTTFPDLVDLLLPVLVREGCAFKLARSVAVLRSLNDGATAPAAVGKAFTIYPEQDRVRELGFELVELLAGMPGPRVLSDRQIHPTAPVYYRYGPFVSSWVADQRGRLTSRLHGPDGTVFEGLATLRYRQPRWAVDPFTGRAGDDDNDSEGNPTTLGGHYRITNGIYQSARGCVYRAVDERSGTTVAIKQARAFVNEGTEEQNDTRLRLRNERRVLQVLDGVPGVPRFLDHFRHGQDEFLVCSYCGPTNLQEDVGRNGRYSVADRSDSPRSLSRLATQLARLLLSLHDRGVVMLDFTPKNLVLDGDRISLVDFGLASYAGLHIAGGTAGYAPGRQMRGEPPRETDDLHGLGMTLLFAAYGLHPVPLGGNSDLPRLRALQALRQSHGAQLTGVFGAIRDLLAEDEAAHDAIRWLATGSGDRPASRPLPPAVQAPPERVAELADAVLAELLDQADRLLGPERNPRSAPDASIYSGAAGIGLELLHHLARPGVADRVEDLARFSAQTTRQTHLPPGLFVGSTGVDVFFAQARDLGIAAPCPDPSNTSTDWQPESDDLIVGAAGVGLGHLMLYRVHGEPAHLEVARRCGERLLASVIPSSAYEVDRLPESAAVDHTLGRAHGLAGSLELLLALAESCTDDQWLRASAERAYRLADGTLPLLRRVSDPAAVPLAVSWCRGLTGIGQILLRAGAVLSEPAFTALARRIGDACLAFLPRVPTPGQCCGAAGIGNLFVDLAVQDQEQRYWDAAHEVVVHMLMRSGGTTDRPAFIADSPDDARGAWANGLAGILGFLRRLRDRGGPNCLPLSGDVHPPHSALTC
jgi:serine/threonine protein kinase